MTHVVVVTTTVGSAGDADRLGRLLVEERLAACAQVVGPIHSWYRWQGEVEQAEEWRCEAKTTVGAMDAVMRRIAELHAYDTPEILVTPVIDGAGRYLAWVDEQTGG